MKLLDQRKIDRLGLTFERWENLSFVRLVIKDEQMTLIELPYWTSLSVDGDNLNNLVDAFNYDMQRLESAAAPLQALLELVYSTCAKGNERLAVIDMFQRRQNQIICTEILEFSGIDYSSHNNGVHLIIYTQDKSRIVDFWPSTELYIWRDTKRRGQGIDRLLDELADWGI